MTRDFEDFDFYVESSRGIIKVSHNKNSMRKIYQVLFGLGFRKSSLDKKRIFYCRQNSSIIPTTITEIKLAFRDFIKNGGLQNIPIIIKVEDILEWYYRDDPIKENGVFDDCLKDTLDELESHQYRLLSKPAYKHKF